MYSITNKQSFLKMRDYLDSIHELIRKSEDANEKKFIKVILLGNKIDMERHRYFVNYPAVFFCRIFNKWTKIKIENKNQ